MSEMSDSMECPDPPEVLHEKLQSMAFEWVRVVREEDGSVIRGHLLSANPNTWEIKGKNDSWARFSLKNVVSICPSLIQITIKPFEPE